MKNDFTEMKNKHLNISQKIEHLEQQNEDNYSTMVDFKNDFNKNVKAQRQIDQNQTDGVQRTQSQEQNDVKQLNNTLEQVKASVINSTDFQNLMNYLIQEQMKKDKEMQGQIDKN